MNIKVIENSPDTPKGSVTKDLNLSKMWLFKKLESLKLTEFDNIYVLGSWYGSLSLFLIESSLKFKTCYCIEIDREKVEYTRHYLKRMQLLGKIQSVLADANEIEYKGEQVLVINTSTNDIDEMVWYDNIKPGTLCVFQGRDHQAFGGNGIDTLKKFNQSYTLSETLFLGHLPLDDVHGDPYLRFMKIGYK